MHWHCALALAAVWRGPGAQLSACPQWLAWDLQVVSSDYINAATDGVGGLFVSSRLLQHLGAGAGGEGQLAAVLAHEVAHCWARHAEGARCPA